MSAFLKLLLLWLVCFFSVTAGSGVNALELRLIRTIGGPALMELYPSGIAVDPHGGNLIAADTGNDRLREYSADGTPIRTFGAYGHGVGQLSYPRDIAMDDDGNIYFSDRKNRRVVKLRRDYTWLGSLPINAMGISVKGGKVYITDPERGSVQVWNQDLTNQELLVRPNGICTFGSSLSDVDADAAGNIYLSDKTANGVYILGADGTCLRRLSGNGHRAISLRVAHDPVLGQELLYETSTSSSPRVRVYRLDGSYVGGISSSAFLVEPWFMDVAPDGDIWVADESANRVKRFDRTPRGWVEAQTIPSDSPPTSLAPKPLADDAMFNTVNGIAFGSDGTVYAADYMNARIVHLTSDGGVINACPDPHGTPTSRPLGLAVDTVADEIWFLQAYSSHVDILRADCVRLATLRLEATPGFTPFRPVAIAIRAADRIAFIADRDNHRIVAYDVATRQPLTTFGSVGSGINQFRLPSGITVHPVKGTVLVADSGNARLVELQFERGTFLWRRTISQSSLNGEFGDVAIDRHDHIYVADNRRSQVLVMADSGTVAATIQDLRDPAGITVSPTDEVFVADSHNDRIRVYSYSLLVNGGFENGLADWTGWRLGEVTTTDVYGGARAAVFSSPVAFSNSIQQTTTGLPAGTYTASIWYKRLNGVRWARLRVRVLNPATGAISLTRTAGMPTTGAWTRAEIPDIPVNPGETISLNVWMDSSAGGTLYLDDAELR
ncbi:NHL repeat-containing protein [Methylotetracoccus oryzae]|uniref:NHL repeat-containing protein n=1 Tax=Methylotetracoccus oryzae TaxID=1919059 RepID=UPI001118F6D0|nr:NHL repeat-containing protein [Methylotetracoccus oryzae]